MKTVELFSGTKSFSQVADDLGYDTFTIDNDPTDDPDLCKNILDVGIDDIPFKPDVIWASPPCTTFSVASISTHWTGGKNAYIPKTDECINGIKLVNKTLSLINQLNPKYWIIENPRGVLRKIGIMRDLPKNTVWYCRYLQDIPYEKRTPKPTDLWNNITRWNGLKCKNGNYDCHPPAPRGSKTGTQGLKDARKRGVIPSGLFYEIFDVIEEVDNK